MNNTISFISKLSLSILLIIVLFSSQASFASAEESFKEYLNNWNQKIKLASEYLDEAEIELKNGDAIQGCIKQKQAAEYGIEASESLIKAFQLNRSEQDIKNIEVGLRKWKELKVFC